MCTEIKNEELLLDFFKGHFLATSLEPPCDFKAFEEAAVAKKRKNVRRCRECDFVCETSDEMRTHSAERHDRNDASDTESTSYSCERCDYATKRSSDFKRHLRKHENSEDDKKNNRIFECDLCTYKTIRPSDLKRHMQTHLRRNPRKTKYHLKDNALRNNILTNLLKK